MFNQNIQMKWEKKNSLAVSCFKSKTQEMEISPSESLASWMFRLEVNEREPFADRASACSAGVSTPFSLLSLFFPALSRCSVHGADACPGCWMKTSTSSPSLNSLVMCMLLQLTSSLFVIPLFLFSPLSSIRNHSVFDIVTRPLLPCFDPS